LRELRLRGEATLRLLGLDTLRAFTFGTQSKGSPGEESLFALLKRANQFA
jgi:hypothetical protein